MNDDALADQAQDLLFAGDAETAADMLRQLLERAPDTDRYQFRHALALHQLGQTDAALAGFRRAVELNPTFGIFHHKYMSLLADRGDFDAALAAYGEDMPIDGLTLELRQFFAQRLLGAGCDAERVRERIAGVFGDHCKAVRACDSSSLPLGSVRLETVGGGFIIDATPETLRNPIFCERLMSMRVYFDMLALAGGEHRAALLCLDDLPPPGREPVLCFSGNAPHHLLVPDALFTGSNAYAHFRELAVTHTTPWDQRKPVAYWRGALTGLAGSADEVLALPRITLAALSARVEALDARITDIGQYRGMQDAILPRIEALGLIGPREAEAENFTYRWMVDVDGNSNAWASLFLKLLTTSPVIKVLSGFRQWYYPRLVAGRDFIGVYDIEEGVPEAIAWCRAHEDQARAIGVSGASRAAQMTVASEFPAFRQAFAAASRSGG